MNKTVPEKACAELHSQLAYLKKEIPATDFRAPILCQFSTAVNDGSCSDFYNIESFNEGRFLEPAAVFRGLGPR